MEALNWVRQVGILWIESELLNAVETMTGEEMLMAMMMPAPGWREIAKDGETFTSGFFRAWKFSFRGLEWRRGRRL